MGKSLAIEYRASALVGWCEGAVQQHDTTGKTQAFDDDRLRYSYDTPPRPNRQVGQRQGSGCSACVRPVAGGSHEASEPGQKGFERHVLAASELRCPGVQPWQDGLGRTKAKTRTGDPSVVEMACMARGGTAM